MALRGTLLTHLRSSFSSIGWERGLGPGSVGVAWGTGSAGDAKYFKGTVQFRLSVEAVDGP